MSGSNELDKFREEWKRELHLHHSNSESENAASKAGPSRSSPSEHVVEHKVDHYKDEYLPLANGALVNQLLCDDTSQDAADVEEDNLTKPKVYNVPDTEYYPFKILTQFLNEAPRRVKPTISKTKYSQPRFTYTKRKYFSQEQPGSRVKKSKEEVSVSHSQTESNESNSQLGKKMLDIFIADLDEINEIPFFDSTLPREVAIKIFQHLDMKSLCRCSQVSHSWRSLADDELLWFRICQKLGYDSELHVSEDEGWKNKVKRYTEQKQLLNVNWRARIGKPYHLHFARGGVLCAVTSHGSNIIAGYTSCNVRSWDTKSGDVCTFNASNTALVLDENADDFGRIHNEIKQVSATASVTAASFKHGFVDIWCNNEGMDPVHTFTFHNPDVTSLAAQDTGCQCSLVAASQGTRVQIHSIGDSEGSCLCDFNMDTPVTQVDWYSTCQSNMSSHLLITCHSSVWLKNVELQPHWIPGKSTKYEPDLTEIQNIIWAPITTVGYRSNEDEIAIGYNLYTGASTQVKVNIYDVSKNHIKATLTGHTWLISCIHMPEALSDQLVTGSGDRKIRLYDLRVGPHASTTLLGHVAKVTSVEMDDWKVVSGDEGGFVNVWDQRMCRKLWDVHNRHPVQYCHFDERLLIIGNVPYQKFPEADEFETVSSLRYRGTVQVYDFLANQQTQGIPDICLSSYNEPEAYDYNIGLAVPYDVVN